MNVLSEVMTERTTRAPHEHRWTGLVLERASGDVLDDRGNYREWGATVIQSCECGVVRRTEVPE